VPKSLDAAGVFQVEWLAGVTEQDEVSQNRLFLLPEILGVEPCELGWHRRPDMVLAAVRLALHRVEAAAADLVEAELRHASAELASGVHAARRQFAVTVGLRSRGGRGGVGLGGPG